MCWGHLVAELEGGPVMIVGAFDVHRRQITFDWVVSLGPPRRRSVQPRLVEDHSGMVAQARMVTAFCPSE
jgi:hypothetical protein